MQRLEQLAGRIAKLNPAQLELVEKLMQRLESASSSLDLTLEQAVDEFEREHPELLHLLAQ